MTRFQRKIKLFRGGKKEKKFKKVDLDWILEKEIVSKEENISIQAFNFSESER